MYTHTLVHIHLIMYMHNDNTTMEPSVYRGLYTSNDILTIFCIGEVSLCVHFQPYPLKYSI